MISATLNMPYTDSAGADLLMPLGTVYVHIVKPKKGPFGQVLCSYIADEMLTRTALELAPNPESCYALLEMRDTLKAFVTRMHVHSHSGDQESSDRQALDLIIKTNESVEELKLVATEIRAFAKTKAHA